MAVMYRGHAIERDDSTRPGRPGRYRVAGRLFTQLNHAKTWIDQTLEG